MYPKFVQVGRKGATRQIRENITPNYFLGSPTEVTRGWILTHNGSNTRNHASMYLWGP